MIELSAGSGLADLLEVRGDQMAVCREVEWLAPFADVPADAAPPLAMSGPHPRAVGSYGAGIVEWMRAELKITPRWWQALAMTRQFEHDSDGQLVWREDVETAPRRSGKSVRIRGAAAWRTTRGSELFGEPQLSMLVSKDLAVGKEIHRGLWRWAEQRGWNVFRLGGAQEVESPAGDRWLLRAPNAAYGYDVGYGQIDEAWGVDPQAITEGIEPALLERASPQLHLTSTAHARASSLMRRRLVAAAKDADPDVLVMWWGAHPDADFSFEETWRAASPYWTEARRALIARKYSAALAGQDDPEFDDPDPVRGWAAQYLNVWPLLMANRHAEEVLPGWSQIEVAGRPEGGPSAVGVSANVAQSWLSLGAAIPGERLHLASVHRMRAVQRAEFVAEVYRMQSEYGCAVGISEKGAAKFLIPDLTEAGVRVTPLNLDEIVQSHADLSSAVKRGAVEHGGYQDLDDALAGAGWKRVGARRILVDKLGDIDALEAAAIAMRTDALELAYDPLDSIA